MNDAEYNLDEISGLTLAYYNQRAEEFRAGTRDHDVSQNIDALLRHIVGQSPFTILDFGCGPGRDLATFTRLGHRAIGLDGAESFAHMARTDAGCEVWHQDFLRLELPDGRFDGIFANASLFHIPSRELPRILRQLHATLKPGGVLFCSNPHGPNVEGWNSGRYGAYHDHETWRSRLTEVGFIELEHYYRPTGLAREQQPWLASVWRKAALTNAFAPIAAVNRKFRPKLKSGFAPNRTVPFRPWGRPASLVGVNNQLTETLLFRGALA